MCKACSCLRCGVQPYHAGVTCHEHAQSITANSDKNEAQFLQWMKETGSRQCPVCGVGMTKQNLNKQKTQFVECHKMQCRNCGTRFCFKCMAILTSKYSCGCS